MNLILLGAPGAGKGTQAQMLIQQLDIPSISTGNMLREAMKNGSNLGMLVKSYMDEGRLVPDELVLSIVAERVREPDCKNGFILDGVPRTLFQAQELDRINVPIDYVVSLEVDDDVIVNRMSGRRVCPKCGASYHIAANPPKRDGICDCCRTKLEIRKDDAPETVLNRLKIYHDTTEVLKAYYQVQGKLRLIEGTKPIEDANADILRAIGETK